MIVLDTSGVVALVVRSDTHLSAAVDVLRQERLPIMIPTGIMAEIVFVLQARVGETSVIAFLDSILTGTILWSCGDGELDRVRELMVRYADLPLGFADATVIACAERNGMRVLTFDRRHFEIVARERTITIVPSQ